MLPSATIGGRVDLYEPVHGSAPDIAGTNRANPFGAIASVAMLLRHTARSPARSRPRRRRRSATCSTWAFGPPILRGRRPRRVDDRRSATPSSHALAELIDSPACVPRRLTRSPASTRRPSSARADRDAARSPLGRARRPRARRRAVAALRRSAPRARGDVAAGVQRPARRGPPRAAARSHVRHGRSQRADDGAAPADRRRARAGAARRAAPQLRRRTAFRSTISTRAIRASCTSSARSSA